MNEVDVFVKKTVQINATQWDGTDEDAARIVAWAAEYKAEVTHAKALNVIRIHTLEGIMDAKPGTFIIKGIENEFYPCEPRIFYGTYTSVKTPLSIAIQDFDQALKLSIVTLTNPHQVAARDMLRNLLAKVVDAAREEERDAEPKEYANEGTFEKIYEVTNRYLDRTDSIAMIGELQNSGVLFRERV